MSEEAPGRSTATDGDQRLRLAIAIASRKLRERYDAQLAAERLKIGQLEDALRRVLRLEVEEGEEPNQDEWDSLLERLGLAHGNLSPSSLAQPPPPTLPEPVRAKAAEIEGFLSGTRVLQAALDVAERRMGGTGGAQRPAAPPAPLDSIVGAVVSLLLKQRGPGRGTTSTVLLESFVAKSLEALQTLLQDTPALDQMSDTTSRDVAALGQAIWAPQGSADTGSGAGGAGGRGADSAPTASSSACQALPPGTPPSLGPSLMSLCCRTLDRLCGASVSVTLALLGAASEDLLGRVKEAARTSSPLPLAPASLGLVCQGQAIARLGQWASQDAARIPAAALERACGSLLEARGIIGGGGGGGEGLPDPFQTLPLFMSRFEHNWSQLAACLQLIAQGGTAPVPQAPEAATQAGGAGASTQAQVVAAEGPAAHMVAIGAAGAATRNVCKKLCRGIRAQLTGPVPVVGRRGGAAKGGGGVPGAAAPQAGGAAGAAAGPIATAGQAGTVPMSGAGTLFTSLRR